MKLNQLAVFFHGQLVANVSSPTQLVMYMGYVPYEVRQYMRTFMEGLTKTQKINEWSWEWKK